MMYMEDTFGELWYFNRIDISVCLYIKPC